MAEKYLKNYINGQWVEPVDIKYREVLNPSTDEVIAHVPLSGRKDVDFTVNMAKEAFESWRSVSPAKRCKYMFRLVELINENFEELSGLISYEEGKNLVDAKAEMKRVLENAEVAAGIPSFMMGDFIEDVSEGIEGYTIKQPIGVFGVICPFNFPAMVPFWFFPYAVAAGNTVVIKASVQVPLTMSRIMELIDKAGFPPGVVNLLNGSRDVSDAMLDNPDIKGISFVGSTSVARMVASRCSSSGKRYQALGGAKNFLIVMPDAKLDKVVSSLNTSCFGCAGERCMAASVIVGVGNIYTELRERFREAALKLIVGNALDPEVDVGPVISREAKERILSYIQQGIDDGAGLVLDGRNPAVRGDSSGYYIGPTILENITWNMSVWKEEIFGPVACMVKAGTFEEALEMMNSHSYGNGGSIFTQSGYYAREFQYKAKVGMVGINIGVPAPAAVLPFGGVKASMFGDIKAQGKGVVDFFTEKKIVTARFYNEDWN